LPNFPCCKLPFDETKKFLIFILPKKATFCQSRKQQCENVSCVVAFLQVFPQKNQKVYYGGTLQKLPSDETKEFLFFILSKKAPFCQS